MPSEPSKPDQPQKEPEPSNSPGGKTKLLDRAEIAWQNAWRKLSDGVRRSENALHPHKRALQGLEIGCAVGVFIFALLYLIMFYEQMSRGSLWIDELGNVFEFVQRGPLFVATQYPIARNHVFYNLLLSILPLPVQEPGDVSTLEVRLVSFIITAGLGLVILLFFARRRQYLEGAAIFALWAFREPLMQLSLHQRSYSLLGLFALLSGIVLLKFFNTGHRRWFYLLCLFCGLGIYTMPAYVLFAAPLMLLSWWFSGREFRTMLAGVLTALGVLLLYLPILRQVMSIATNYHDDFGLQYYRSDAMFTTLHYYTWPLPLHLLVMSVILLPIIAGWIYRRQSKPEGQVIMILFTSVFTFLAICLWMQTTPLRTTSFVALPLLLITGLLAARLLRPLPARSLAAVALLLFTAVKAPALMEDLRIVPYENWEEAHRTLITSLPEPATFNLNDLALGMQYYMDLDQNYSVEEPEILEPPSKEIFESGRYAVVTGQWIRESAGAKDQFDAEEFSDRGFQLLFVGRFRHLRLNLAVPPATLVADRQILTPDQPPGLPVDALRITPQPGPDGGVVPMHSLNFLLADEGCWPQQDPAILILFADTPEAPPEKVPGIEVGPFLTFPLDGRPISRVLVVADPDRVECLREESIEHVWFQPVTHALPPGES